ncbi:MAG: hypothetical protein FIB08_15185 [Candidatus Methanoperedens sp.]|nr:hypothetical protein [Candidatus Methanoperedens sp.]
MGVIEKIFNLIYSKNTIKEFLYGFLILLSIDILSTIYILTFFPETTEKNFIARFFISKFGNFWGLIVSVPFEFVNLGIIFIFVYVILYILIEFLKRRMKKRPDISCLSLTIILFIAIVFHLNGVINNLLLLVRLIFGF